MYGGPNKLCLWDHNYVLVGPHWEHDFAFTQQITVPLCMSAKMTHASQLAIRAS